MNGIYFTRFMQLYNGYKLNIPPKGEKESKTAYVERIKEFKKREDLYEPSEYTKVSFIPQKCVALTDNDPSKDSGLPQKGEHLKGENPFLYYKKQSEAMTNNCRVFVNSKTFEYDLAIESHHNAKLMLKILLSEISSPKWQSEIKKQIDMINSDTVSDDAQMAYFILTQIESSELGKGLFAQLLSDAIDDNFDIPLYITEAIDFMLGIENE